MLDQFVFILTCYAALLWWGHIKSVKYYGKRYNPIRCPNLWMFLTRTVSAGPFFLFTENLTKETSIERLVKITRRCIVTFVVVLLSVLPALSILFIIKRDLIFLLGAFLTLVTLSLLNDVISFCIFNIELIKQEKGVMEIMKKVRSEMEEENKGREKC